MSALRSVVAWLMLVLFPLSLTAADTGSAILRSAGGVWVNGNEIAGSTAIFAGDTLETKPGFVANLDLEGSSVLIQPESIVKFDGTYLTLEHGSVSVGTSTGMSVHVNCIRVEPLSNDRTQYDVADVTGKVDVAAHKADVKITQSGSLHKPTAENSSASSVVHEGQQGSRDESQACGAAELPQTAGHTLPTKWIEIAGGAGGGAVVICLLLCKGSPKKNVSQSDP